MIFFLCQTMHMDMTLFIIKLLEQSHSLIIPQKLQIVDIIRKFHTSSASIFCSTNSQCHEVEGTHFHSFDKVLNNFEFDSDHKLVSDTQKSILGPSVANPIT